MDVLVKDKERLERSVVRVRRLLMQIPELTSESSYFEEVNFSDCLENDRNCRHCS